MQAPGAWQSQSLFLSPSHLPALSLLLLPPRCHPKPARRKRHSCGNAVLRTPALPLGFRRVFSLLKQTKKRNSKICTSGKISFLWPWKTLCRACTKHGRKQPTLGSTGKRTKLQCCSRCQLQNQQIMFWKNETPISNDRKLNRQPW